MMTEAEMIAVIKGNRISECSPEEKAQVMAFAFGDEFMSSEDKGALKEYAPRTEGNMKAAGFILIDPWNGLIFGQGSTPEDAKQNAIDWLQNPDDADHLDGCEIQPATRDLLWNVENDGADTPWAVRDGVYCSLDEDATGAEIVSPEHEYW